VCIVVGPSENNEGTWLRSARRCEDRSVENTRARIKLGQITMAYVRTV
jgi:hypothetical protein